MKKLGILLLACITALNLWAEEFKIGKFRFEIKTPTTVELIDADADITNAFLSETIDYEGNSYTLTYIRYQAFRDCSSLTSVTIPNSVTEIGSGAFRNCTGLTSITIPNSVTEIGWGAFDGCESLTSITIPNSVTKIGWGAFDGCESLTSITIPNSVTNIGGAFVSCSSLKSIIVQHGNPIYDSRENCNAIIETTTNTLIAGCQNTIIPNSVTSIGWWAFANCSSLKSITIPNSVTSIKTGAFYGCSSLTSLNIPNSVTSIEKGAFYKCSSLDSITIPADISMTDNYADSIDLPILPPPPPPPAVQKEDVLNVVEDEVEEVMAVDPTNDEGDEMVYMVVETMPEFPGGTQAMMRFIGENIIYPTYAQEKRIQGRVICQFVIEKDGKVTDIQIVRSSGEPSLDKEAVRVINSMPKWKPGKQRGKPVRVKYTVPVNFRLQ